MSKHKNIEITHIEQAIQILSYNDHWWEGFSPHAQDLATIRSLAETPYAYTEKQGKLAVSLLKRYHTLFQKFGIDLTTLIEKPVFRDPFRIIDFEKSIKKFTHDDKDYLELKFPYNKKLIQLIRCLKHEKTQGIPQITYDGDSKKWIMPYSEVAVYYCVLIAVRYDFKFYDHDLLQEYQNIKAIKLTYKKPFTTVSTKKIIHKHVTQSFEDWWDRMVSKKEFIVQCDILKQLGIDTKFEITPSNLTEKIAFSDQRQFWIDRGTTSKIELLNSLQILESLPALVPVGHEFTSIQDIDEVYSWYDAFDSVGIKKDQVAWGFTMEPAPDYRPPKDSEEKFYFQNPYPENLPEYEKQTMLERWQDLCVISKADKYIDHNTKIIFVKLKIPRALIKSGVEIKSTFNMLDSEYFPNVSDTMSKMVENLPKRIYYVTKDKHTFLSNNKNEFM